MPLLAEMEMNGVLLDRALLMEMSSSLGTDMQRLEKDIYDAVGHQFNINSPQQLSGVLFNELKLKPMRPNARHRAGFSTDAAVLEELKDAHPVIKLILEYRQLTKLKSTYMDALPVLINPAPGRVHTSFNQTGTTTGRLSSSEPNLQNLPVRGEIGSRIRQAIIAQPGWLLLSADYSQIDLRALAHLSQDSELIDTFQRDEDIHTPHGFGGLRRARTPRSPAHAPRRQDDQLRRYLRHERLRSPAGHRPEQGGGGAVHQRLFQALSRGQELPRGDQEAGRGAGLRADAAGPAALYTGDQLDQPAGQGGRRAHGHQYARAGHIGGHHQDRHGQPAPRDAEARHEDA